MTTLPQKLAQVLNRIQTASNGRENVKLIAVSKTKPLQLIQEAYNCGQRIFGENRVQEARSKAQLLPEEIQWHLLGPLQKNKAKYCPGLFTTIHSLHRADIATAINQQAQKKDKIIDVLIQMNLSGEESKSGVGSLDELQYLEDQLLTLSNLRLIGLMTIGDPQAGDNQNQKYFAQLREILHKQASRLGLNAQMKELSMGMSGDFELALKEGATFVRVGSAIFGERV